MTSSFKIYLPSNACQEAFPRNTPTDYYTRFDKPINLKGDWEVGVEAIAYSSHINDKSDRAYITFTAQGINHAPIYSLIRDKFHLIEGGEWKGLKGIVPTKFEKDVKNIDEIIRTLNDMNYLILKKNPSVPFVPLFSFARNKKGNVFYENRNANFTIRITEKLSNILGFGGICTFTAGEYYVAGKRISTNADEAELTKEDYYMTCSHIELQKRELRIIIKDHGEAFDGEEATFLTLWNKVVEFYKIRTEFDSMHMLSIHNDEENITFVFSYDLYRSLGCSEVIIGRQSNKTANSVDFSRNFLLDLWYIDIYSTKMEQADVMCNIENLQLHLYPWRSSTVKQLLHHVNLKVKAFLQNSLKSTPAYDKTKHNFKLTIEASGHCKLTLGKWLQVMLSPNLAYLLSLPDYLLRRPEVIGMREIDVLETHLRQLFLLSNVIKPTYSGEQQRHIICDFLHKAGTERILEKHFHPISYHPIARNKIDEIHLQLTDSQFYPIAINDIESIVTLYFRKLK